MHEASIVITSQSSFKRTASIGESGTHTQYLDKAWEKKTGVKQLKPPSGKTKNSFYQEDLKDRVKPCEITCDKNKPLI